MRAETVGPYFILNRDGVLERVTKPVKHGYYATYSNRGCRCLACKEAHAAWHRQYRRSANGKSTTVKANRKSRRIQQQAAEFLRVYYPDLYATIVSRVNEGLGD